MFYINLRHCDSNSIAIFRLVLKQWCEVARFLFTRHPSFTSICTVDSTRLRINCFFLLKPVCMYVDSRRRLMKTHQDSLKVFLQSGSFIKRVKNLYTANNPGPSRTVCIKRLLLLTVFLLIGVYCIWCI